MSKAPKKAKRLERRFVPRSAANPWMVRGLGALAAILLGAGLYGYFKAETFAKEAVDKYYEGNFLPNLPAYAIALGAIVMAAVIWVGTSGEPPVRVGDPGIAIEKGEVRRLPWWGVKSIVFETGALQLVVAGKDESGSSLIWKFSLKAYPEAIGWIVKEADDRIPKKMEIGDETFSKLPPASEHAGMRLELEPLQVVGKKCAASGRSISYEPDARVCTRCERVYLRKEAPKRCKCGRPLDAAKDVRRPDADAKRDDGDTSDDSSESASENAET